VNGRSRTSKYKLKRYPIDPELDTLFPITEKIVCYSTEQFGGTRAAM